MITEDYVSFEVAKLLKEKRMDKSCFKHYVQKNNNDGTSEAVTVCTLQMAMKWLREVHNLVICAEIGNENDKGNTDYSNPDKWYWFFDITNEKGVVIGTESDYILNEYPSYEEACEAAIQYCLENLI